MSNKHGNFVLMFNADSVIHLAQPSDDDATAEIVAERFRFLTAIAGAISRFNEEIMAAGKTLDK